MIWTVIFPTPSLYTLICSFVIRCTAFLAVAQDASMFPPLGLCINCFLCPECISFYLLFFFLTASHSLRELSSRVRDWTWIPSSGSMQSKPLGHQGIPQNVFGSDSCMVHSIFSFIFLTKCHILTVYYHQSVQSLSRVRLFATHELQHARPPCPSPTPGVHSDSRPSSQWCHPAVLSSVVPFSSCPQSLPASKCFPMS